MSIGGINYNIIISQGIPIVVSKGIQDNYAFTYVDFSKTQLNMLQNDVTNPEQYGGAAGNNFLELRYMMNGKNQMILMHKIGDSPQISICPTGGSVSTKDTVSGLRNSLMPINPALQQQYNNLPTGIVTPVGSIIPQPLVPTDDYVGCDNGVYINSDYTQMPFFSQYGYCWSAYKMTSVKGADASVQSTIKRVNLYGVHQQLGYVSNEQARNALIDFPVIANRKYVCNVGSSYSKKGSCVICYKFYTYNIYGQGQTKDEITNIPHILVTLDAAVSTFDEKEPAANQNSISGGLNVLIPPDNQITVLLNKYKNQGAFSTPSTDLFPPQSKMISGEGLTNVPLFIYPLYTGLVVTNSIIKNTRNASEQIFVKFPTLSPDPRNSVDIINVPYISNEIKSHMSGDVDYKMQWFPALFQGCNSSQRDNIKLKIKPKQSVTFGDNVEVMFTKAAGNFAYCPLYFHRNLQFTLLFKGQYVNQAKEGQFNINGIAPTARSSDFKYYLFPLVYANEQSYKYYTTSGAPCIKVERNYAQKSGDTNCLVCQDSYLQQAIFRAKFQFSSAELERYPIQVFGAVLVMHRPTISFPIFNANGNFVFCSDSQNGNFASQYSAITSYGKQLSKKNFYQLITNCHVQTSLEGVSGDLTLDAYPLNQQINTLMQSQSIGQIDLDVHFINNLGQIQIDYSNPNSSIFKGYGMEITTESQQNNYSIRVNLAGIQRKIEDMKLVCAPFWDGDRLQSICSYFQDYLNVNLKMVNYNCEDIKNALPVREDCYDDIFTKDNNEGAWKSNRKIAIGDDYDISSPDFRVGRSFSWESPHINFQTGKSCMQALNELAQDTSCVFVVGLDGTGYFYELNDFGYPYYVEKQIKKDTVVEIDLADISSISLSPSIINKYNSIATLGFIVKKKDGRIDQNSIAASTQPGIYYTNIKDDSKYAGKTLFPWTRHNIGMEQGYLTRTELLNLHKNRVLFSISDVYTGNIVVRGNTMVDHVYQVIKINGIFFHVYAIDHNIDLQNKSWTTTYTIAYQNISQTANGGNSGN